MKTCSRIGVLLVNSCGQCGYQWWPQNIHNKLSDLMTNNKKFSNKKNCNNSLSDNNSNNSENIESMICEMIFGSVALNFCAQNSSKMHKLSQHLLMTSFIFQIDFSNGKTIHRKYGLAIIWDISECEGLLRQLILKESVIIDSLMNELRSDLIESRLKTPKDIHKSVTKFMKTINDYLSVCRLTSNISDDQFIDELIALLNKYDTKVTHFFVSTLLTSILMFKYKSKKMKLILYSKDVNKISLISQLLLVTYQFLKTKTKTNSYVFPQMKSIKFCRNLSSIRTSSATLRTKSIVSERKSRDESLGYESLTESGSTTTSTICEYNGFTSKSLSASTPLEHSLEQSVDRLGLEIMVDPNDDDSTDGHSSSQLTSNRSNYFREYRNLRFTSNQTSDDSTDEDIDSKTLLPNNNNSDNCRLSDELSDDNDSQNESNFSKDEDYGSEETTDVEVIYESPLVSGFGQISMPQLMADLTNDFTEISLSQSPTISDIYLSQMSIQGLINPKSIDSYEQLLSECLRKSSTELSDNTIIVCDCDLWRINYVESSRSCPAIMSASVGQLCETITEFHSLRMNTHFIRKYIDNKMNELILKSVVLKSLIESNCVDNKNRQNCLKLFERESKESILSLIADNYFNDFSANHCLNLGFDISDIPVIIALNRHSLINNYNNFRRYERNETHYRETNL